MALLTLRLLDGTGTEHVYTSSPRADGGAGLLAGERVVTERATATEVELTDLSLELAGPFCGATSRSALPPPSIAPTGGRGQGAYRACLTHGTRVVLDGAVPRLAAAHDPGPDEWAVTLIAASQADAWRRLEAVRLDALSAAAYADVETARLDYLFRDTGTVAGADRWLLASRFPLYTPFNFGPLNDRPLVVYELRSLVRAVLAASGIALDGDLPTPTYRVQYFHREAPGQPYVVREITRPMVHHVWSLEGWKGGAVSRSNPTLPAWTGAQLVRAALSAYGWRLSASYQPFPSLGIVVRVLADDPPPASTAGLPDLSPRLAAGGYTRYGAQDGASGTAIRHASPLRAAAVPSSVPDAFSDFGGAAGVGAYGTGAVPVPAPTQAALAQDRWTFGPVPPGRDGADPEPEAADVVETGWSLPSVGAPTPSVLLPVWPPADEDGAIPSAAHPGYREWLVYGAPCLDAADAAAYLGVVVEVDGTARLLFARDPAATYGVPDGQPQLVNEAWAPALYELRGRSLAPREVADGAWYVHGLDVRAGDPAYGAALEGAAWVATDVGCRLIDDRASLVLERLSGLPARPQGPARPGRVADLRGRYQHVRISTGESQLLNQRRIIAQWLPPPVAVGADWYVVEIRRAESEDVPAGDWISVVTYGTAFVTAPDPAPAPGQTWEIRVTAIAAGRTGLAASASLTIPEED